MRSLQERVHGDKVLLRTNADVERFRLTWIKDGADSKSWHNRTVVAFKFSKKDGRSVFHATTAPTWTHKIGTWMEVKLPEYNMRIGCGAGVNLASAEWVEHNIGSDDPKINDLHYTIWVCTHSISAVVAVPFADSGKYRVRQARIVGQISSRMLQRMVTDRKYLPKVVARATYY